MLRISGRALFSARRRGFSAVEVIAVATILAILSMTLIMTLRTRVASAKDTTARLELAEFAKIITLAHADTGNYFRLHDYDNRSLSAPGDALAGFPMGYWPDGRSLINNVPAKTVLAQKWVGPYTSFKRYETIENLLLTHKAIFTRIDKFTGKMVGPSGGPVVYWDVNERYPVDPWRGPYIFFAPGRLIVDGESIANQDIFESTYVTPIVYSLGVDGTPGIVTEAELDTSGSKYYFRPNILSARVAWKGLGSLEEGSDDIGEEF